MATQDQITATQAAARAAANAPVPDAAVFGKYPAAGTRMPVAASQFGPGAGPGQGTFPQYAGPGINPALQQGYTLGAPPPGPAGAGRGIINPGAGAPPPYTPPPVRARSGSPDVGSPSANDLVPGSQAPQVGTAGNIIVNGTNAAGKPNSFSGTNVGYGAAYANPDGTGTSVNGQTGIGPDAALNAAARMASGAQAPAAAPVVAAAATQAGATPAAPGAPALQTSTANAGMPQPVGATSAAATSPGEQSSPFGFGLSGQQQASQGAFANPPPTAATPSTIGQVDPTGAVARANAIQDQQLQLAQHALQLAGTGNLSDAIMAKHIRSTMAALGQASQAGSSAVNPILTGQQQSATAERNADVQAATSQRDTDVQASSARYGHNLAAATQLRQQDVESYFKMPAHQQAQIMTMLQAQAAAGNKEALNRIAAITDAQDKTATVAMGTSGRTEAILKHNNWMIAPPDSTPGQTPIGVEGALARRQGLVSPAGAP